MPSEFHGAKRWTPSKRTCDLSPERLGAAVVLTSHPTPPAMPRCIYLTGTYYRRLCCPEYSGVPHTDGRPAHPPAVEPSDPTGATTRRPPPSRIDSRLHPPTGAYPPWQLHRNVRYAWKSTVGTQLPHMSIYSSQRRWDLYSKLSHTDGHSTRFSGSLVSGRYECWLVTRSPTTLPSKDSSLPGTRMRSTEERSRTCVPRTTCRLEQNPRWQRAPWEPAWRRAAWPFAAGAPTLTGVHSTRTGPT